MQEIGEIIRKEEPLFGFMLHLSGSCREGTKAIAMNEADVLLQFDSVDWQNLVLKEIEPDNLTYVLLSESTPFLKKSHPQLFCDSFLSVQAVLSEIYTRIRELLPEVLKRHKNLYCIDTSYILHRNRSIDCLHLVYHGPSLPWQPFSVDIVPAIPLKSSQIPTTLKNRDIIRDVVYVVPKWTFELIDKTYSDKAFQFCFTNTESHIFSAMPTALKHGYTLTKVVLHKSISLIIEDIESDLSSYMLKSKAFDCFTDLPH